MANVGFRLGPQTNVDKIIGESRGAINGSFYLTNDSHRLYIGAESDINAGEYTLYPVNEGVETVKTLTDLTSREWDAQTKKACAGRFYYIEDRNVLAIFNGKDFIQINVDTDTSIKDVSFTGTKKSDASIDIDHTITWGDSNNQSVAKLKLITDNGLECKTEIINETNDEGAVIRSYPKLTISGDTYSFSTAVVDKTNEFTLFLDSENQPLPKLPDDPTKVDASKADPSRMLNLKGKGGIHFSLDEDGNVVVSSDDTHLLEDSISIENTSTGFRVTVKDSSGIHSSSALWSPFITYGKAEDPSARSKAQFTNGTAFLDIYTADEIDQLMKDLNGMTYKGTIGETGSYATKVVVDGTTSKIIRGSGSTAVEVQCSIGDMCVLEASTKIGNKTYAPGTIIICRSTSNKENSDGYIESTDLTFDIIDAIENVDTTYKLVPLESANGVLLKDKNGLPNGILEFSQGKAQKRIESGDSFTYVDVEGLNVAVKADTSVEGKTTIIFYHEAIARTNETETVAQVAQKVEFKAIKSIETDETGHVSKVVTQDVTVYDTANDVSGNTFATDSYKTNGKSVGIVKNTVTSTNKYTSAPTDKADTFVLISESLAITNDDTQSDKSGGTDLKQGLSIEMVWGSF